MYFSGFAVVSVSSCLVNIVSKNCCGVISIFSSTEDFNYLRKVPAFVEVVSTGLLNESITIDHREMHLWSELSWDWSLPANNGANM